VQRLDRKQLQRYATDGFGLWAIELRETGGFVGDCGLTVQTVDDAREVEVGVTRYGSDDWPHRVYVVART
jgi:[ribosomal protein S5]-alanine N-acetyltransferase